MERKREKKIEREKTRAKFINKTIEIGNFNSIDVWCEGVGSRLSSSCTVIECSLYFFTRFSIWLTKRIQTVATSNTRFFS